MAVPFQMLAGHIGILLETVDDPRHASGQSHFGKGNPVAHGIAGPDFHGDPGLTGKAHQLIDEGHHKTVKIGAGDIFQMTAGRYPGVKGVADRGQILLHSLTAGHFHLLEYMVIAAAHEDPRFLDAHFLDELEILTAGPDPGGDFREAKAQIHASADGFSVGLAVNKELRLADNALGAAESGHHFIEFHDLICGVRLHRLLSVTEGGVGNPDLFGHLHRHPPMVEGHLGHGVVGVDIAIQVGLFHILQRIFIGFLFQ